MCSSGTRSACFTLRTLAADSIPVVGVSRIPTLVFATLKSSDYLEIGVNGIQHGRDPDDAHHHPDIQVR